MGRPDDKLRVIRGQLIPNYAALHPGYASRNRRDFCPVTRAMISANGTRSFSVLATNWRAFGLVVLRSGHARMQNRWPLLLNVLQVNQT